MKKRYPSLKADLIALMQELEVDPAIGTDLGGGLRKIRLATTSKGKGKSGGARVITYTIIASVEEGAVYLVSIYDKSDYSSVSVEKIRALLKEYGL